MSDINDQWSSFDTILEAELNKESEDSIISKSKTSTGKAVATLDDNDIFSSVLQKAKQLIDINNATDTATLIQKMREQFIVNRVNTASKGEAAVSLVLSKLIDKLNSEDMPVNTLLKILTQLRDCSVQDMSTLVGAPNPNDKFNKGGGTVVQILNNNAGTPQEQAVQAPVTQSKVEASSDISKFLEISTLAIENIKSGKVNVGNDVKETIEAEFTEVNDGSGNS